jgi:hypothetical protein
MSGSTPTGPHMHLSVRKDRLILTFYKYYDARHVIVQRRYSCSCASYDGVRKGEYSTLILNFGTRWARYYVHVPAALPPSKKSPHPLSNRIQSEFSTQCDLELPPSDVSILSFP